MMIGAVLAGADERQVQAVERIAGDLGVAFQIQDDILDLTSTQEELGKPVGSDEKNSKNTYVSLYGMEAAQAKVEELSRRALEGLKGFEVRNEFLEELFIYLIHRKK